MPSKKRALPYRFGESLPSPRTELFALQDFSLPLARVPEKHVSSDSESDGSDILTPTDVKKSDKDIRLYMPKPRAVLQRRHTLSNFKDLVSVSFWHERQSKLLSNDPQSLRDKSLSFGFGLEMAPRPTTCLGMVSGPGNAVGSSEPGKLNSFAGLKGSLPDIIPPNDPQKSGDEKSENYKPGISKVVRFESNMKFEECHVDTKYTCNVDNTVLETFEPIPYADEEPPAQSVNERVKRFESIANKQCANHISVVSATTSASRYVEELVIIGKRFNKIISSIFSESSKTPVILNHNEKSTINVATNSVNSTTSTSSVAPLSSSTPGPKPGVKPIPMQRQISRETDIAEAINTVLINRENVKRGRLDKSHSTPAYDDDGKFNVTVKDGNDHLQIIYINLIQKRFIVIWYMEES